MIGKSTWTNIHCIFKGRAWYYINGAFRPLTEPDLGAAVICTPRAGELLRLRTMTEAVAQITPVSKLYGSVHNFCRKWKPSSPSSTGMCLQGNLRLFSPRPLFARGRGSDGGPSSHGRSARATPSAVIAMDGSVVDLTLWTGYHLLLSDDSRNIP